MQRTFLAALFCLSIPGLALAQGSVELAARNSSGVPANGSSYQAAISADGNVVAFVSSADNLSMHPAAIGAYSVFVRDRAAGTSELVAVTWDGSPPNQDSRNPSLSATGRYVLFSSVATNLVVNDANGGNSDLFLRDRLLGTTVVAGLTSQGTQSASHVQFGRISGDGRWIVFETAAADFVPGDTNGVSDVFVRDLQTGAVERVSRRSDGSQTSLDSIEGSLSADGSRVAFTSYDQLVPEDTDIFSDVYVLQRSTGVLELVSVGLTPGGVESHMTILSADGGTVAFFSWADNLVPGDTNGTADVFWRELASGTTGRASARSTGAQISGLSAYPAISGDGRTIGFSSMSAVVPGVPSGPSRLYVHDRVTGATRLVDAAADGQPGDQDSDLHLALSGDGRLVAFSSDSNNLVSNDVPQSDVFVHDMASAPPANFCTAKVNSQGCTALVTWTGTPSATSGSPFVLSATNTIGGQFGLLFYGLTPQYVPFQGGIRCVAPPISRTPITFGGGTPGSCSGALSYDFNARIATQVDPKLLSGAVVHAQFWYRDPMDPAGFGSGLSDAVVFAIQP